MTEQKHTPGPWRVYSGARGTIIEADGHPCDDGSPGGILCPGTGGARSWSHTLAEMGWSGTDEWDANARLIAAAPDLLAEVKDWLRDSDGWSVAELRKRYDEKTVQRILRSRAVIAKAEGKE